MATKEAKINKCWIARCEDGALALYYSPNRFFRRTGDNMNGYWESETGICMLIDRKFFPELKWENEPIEVELTIKKKD